MLVSDFALILGALTTFSSWVGVSAFYLPGAASHDYRHGETVDLFVNALTPMLAAADNAKLVRGSRSNLDVSAVKLLV